VLFGPGRPRVRHAFLQRDYKVRRTSTAFVMNIIDANRPYLQAPAKQSRIDALQELGRIETIPNFADQDRESSVMVMIRDLATYWAKGLGAETPLFVQHTAGVTKRVHLIDSASLMVAVYDCTGKDTWERRAILEDPEVIRASLPKRALSNASLGQPASLKQIAAVRKLLELPADRPMPALSAMSASRIMGRIVAENSVKELAADFRRWLSIPRAVAA
jgi:hypothetical protein